MKWRHLWRHSRRKKWQKFLIFLYFFLIYQVIDVHSIFYPFGPFSRENNRFNDKILFFRGKWRHLWRHSRRKKWYIFSSSIRWSTSIAFFTLSAPVSGENNRFNDKILFFRGKWRRLWRHSWRKNPSKFLIFHYFLLICLVTDIQIVFTPSTSWFWQK